MENGRLFVLYSQKAILLRAENQVTYSNSAVLNGVLIFELMQENTKIYKELI